MSFDSASVTGDNVGGGVAYIGDCNFVDGVDQACVSANNDTDPASEPRPFFVSLQLGRSIARAGSATGPARRFATRRVGQDSVPPLDGHAVTA